MQDVFRVETETQAAILTNNLLALEDNPDANLAIEFLISAARSIKGAAKIVQLPVAAEIAQGLETSFLTARSGAINLSEKINTLLSGVDLLLKIAQVAEAEQENWAVENQKEIQAVKDAIAVINRRPESIDILPEWRPSEKPVQESTPFVNLKDPTNTPSPTTFNLSNLDLLDLFRLEVETQAEILSNGLLILENNPKSTTTLESLMRAAHSIKGAARIVGIDDVVKLAHVMEDCFTSAQNNPGDEQPTLSTKNIDILFQAVDLLSHLAQVSEAEAAIWLSEHQVEFENIATAISYIFNREVVEAQLVPPQQEQYVSLSDSQLAEMPLVPVLIEETALSQAGQNTSPANIQSVTLAENQVKPSLPKSPIQNLKSTERVVRVSADNLNRLMGLAGESLVEANWLQPFADSLLKLRNRQAELSNILDKLQESLTDSSSNQSSEEHLKTARQKANECRHILGDRLNELELFARRSANLSDRLYREVIASHMRPFADGVSGFPRMIRDLARQLNKQVKLEIIGKSTQVDRDILEKLEAPLTHILRNAIDHGIEPPNERLASGKSAEGIVRLEASHRAGMLLITVSDDGRGVDLQQLRQKIIDKKMVAADMAAQLTEAELMEFLFLPGFSTKTTVTELSGRGVGLDIAQSMVHEVGGVLRAISQPKSGMSFHLQLPLTLSVIRTLLVEIAGEPYAFPLTRIESIMMLPKDAIAVAENRQYFTMDNQNIGLVAAYQVLELPESFPNSEVLPVIVISDRLSRYGIVVDRFLGERKLVVRPLDTRLGKVQDISAVALMENGNPVLIIDVEDIIRSIDSLLSSHKLNKVSHIGEIVAAKTHKRILVVDDSITVREMQRKLLENKGYEVEIAVNGMDGWNAVRTGHFDLVVTDIDMPRMNGIELVSQIKNHHTLKSLPVIIVSYKDREEDRIMGLEVGANYYLTKSSFHDHTLLNAVLDLIGEG